MQTRAISLMGKKKSTKARTPSPETQWYKYPTRVFQALWEFSFLEGECTSKCPPKMTVKQDQSKQLCGAEIIGKEASPLRFKREFSILNYFEAPPGPN